MRLPDASTPQRCKLWFQNRRVQYGKSQQGGKNRKSKRGREDGEGERNGKGYQENKVNLVIRENSDSKASVYHHIIYNC